MKEGWTYKTIKDCCKELFAGGDVPKPDVSKNKTNFFSVPIYTNGVENEGLYGYTTNAKVYEPAVTISARGTIGATFRRFTPFFPAIRLITAVPNKDLMTVDYLYYALNMFSAGDSGTSIPQLTIPNIKNIILPVPPLSEQQRIVKQLDEAFAEIDTIKATAEKQLSEAKALYQKALSKAMTPKEGWEEKKLGDAILNLRTGLNPRTHFTLNTHDATGYYITVRELRGFSFKIDDKTDRINESAIRRINERSNLIVGDVLYSGTGTIGKTALVTELPLWWNIKEGVYAITPKKELNSVFLIYVMQSENFTNAVMNRTSGATVKSIPMKELREVIIPLPPLSEQQRIVEELDELAENVKEIEKLNDKLTAECDAMKQALLRQIFE